MRKFLFFILCAAFTSLVSAQSCTSGIGTNSESFEDPAVGTFGQGPWAEWTYDLATSTFVGNTGWIKDNLGTGSVGTCPIIGAPSLDGDYYFYCETSGQYNRIANIHSSCVDLNNFTDPSFIFFIVFSLYFSASYTSFLIPLLL